MINLSDNQINNLLSGFFGAIIAVFLTTLLERYGQAHRLNRIRVTLLNYLEYIGLDKSQQYANDMNFIKKMILTTDSEEMQHNCPVDAMPMFTSDIFKSFSPDELRRVCYNSKNYIMAIDISYSTDFLKSNMPLDIYESYNKDVWKHYDEKHLETYEEQLKHLKECGILKQFAAQASNEAEAKLQRAKITHQVIHSLINSLRGFSFFWVLKYFIRQ